MYGDNGERGMKKIVLFAFSVFCIMSCDLGVSIDDTQAAGNRPTYEGGSAPQNENGSNTSSNSNSSGTSGGGSGGNSQTDENNKIYEHSDEVVSNEPAYIIDATGSGAPYLAIVTAPDFKASESLARYKKHKTRQGYVVVDVEGSGKTAEQIRATLKAIYDEKVKNNDGRMAVLLVGNCQSGADTGSAAYLPAFWSTSDDARKPTDYYFGEYDGNYGAYDGKTGDYGKAFVQEAAVGRFSVSSESELQAVVEKTIFMEEGVSARSAADVVGTSRDLNTAWQLKLVESYLTKRGSPPVKLVSSWKEELANAINAGAGFVIYTGHGAVSGFDGFWNEDVPKLSNRDSFPFVVASTCLTGSYQDTSFAEEMVNKADGGAVAYIGASIESLSDRNQQFISGNVTSITQDINQSNYAPALIGSLYHSRAASNDGFKVRTAGGTLQAGFRYLQSVGSSQDGTLKRNVLYTIEIYNLIGDPTYMPYTEAPQKAAIKVLGTVMKGRNFSVSTAPFAQVALTSNDEAIIAVGYADEFGQLTLSVPKECDRHSALLYAIAPNYTGSSVEVQIADESGSASQDATLKTLTVSGAAVDLREGVFEHDIQVAYENNPAVIFAEASSPAAKVTGGGSKYLKLGENKVLITVTSESGNKQTYTLNITRKASALSNNYYLKTLEIFNSASEELPLDGVFDKTAWQFSVHAKRNDTITIRARTEDESAVCWFDGDDEKKAADSFEKTLTGISKYSSGGISHTIYVRTAFGEKKAFGLTVYPD